MIHLLGMTHGSLGVPCCKQGYANLCHEPCARYIRTSKEAGFLQLQQIPLHSFSGDGHGVHGLQEMQRHRLSHHAGNLHEQCKLENTS